MGFIGSSVLEAVTIYAGIVSLLSIVTLRQAGAGALWEFSLGIYLAVKGFRPSPITANM